MIHRNEFEGKVISSILNFIDFFNDFLKFFTFCNLLRTRVLYQESGRQLCHCFQMFGNVTFL
jgi:hypothetical protein